MTNIKEEIDIASAIEAVNILDNVYQCKGDVSAFYLKHYNNPNRIENPIVFFEEDERKVGMNGFMRMALCIHGKRHWVEQSCETGVLKEYRGRSIFTKIIMKQETEDVESEFIFGLPNENSYPGFRKMNFETVAQLSHYVLLVNPFGLLFGKYICLFKIFNFPFRCFFLRKIYSNAKGKHEIYIEENYNFNEDDYSVINADDRVKFERSSSFFLWKQALCPEIKYIIARDIEKKLCGYMVFRYKKEKKGIALVIDDWFAIGDVSDQVNILKHLIMNTVKLKEVSIVEVPLVNKNTLDARVLSQLKFMDICKGPFGFRGSPLIVSPRCKTEEYMKYCEFKNIDKDTF